MQTIMLLEFSMTHLLWTYFNGADSLYKIAKELHQLRSEHQIVDLLRWHHTIEEAFNFRHRGHVINGTSCAKWHRKWGSRNRAAEESSSGRVGSQLGWHWFNLRRWIYQCWSICSALFECQVTYCFLGSWLWWHSQLNRSNFFWEDGSKCSLSKALLGWNALRGWNLRRWHYSEICLEPIGPTPWNFLFIGQKFVWHLLARQWYFWRWWFRKQRRRRMNFHWWWTYFLGKVSLSTARIKLWAHNWGRNFVSFCHFFWSWILAWK